MQIYNLHTHTTLSDGSASIEYVIQKAKEKGYKLGISDHIFCGGINTLEAVERYLDTLGRYEVLRGAEANIGEDFRLPDRLAYKLDYCIASVHYYFNEHREKEWLSSYFGNRAKHHNNYVPNYNKGLCEHYMEQILKMVEGTFKTQRVDIYGHPTVLPFYEDLGRTRFLVEWEDEMIGLCKKYQVALEVSGLWHEPNMQLVQKALRQGVKLSFGCDGHKLEEVCELGYVEKMIEVLGIRQEQCYKPATIMRDND